MVKAIFSYIRLLLKTNLKIYYDEFKQIEENKFKYKSEMKAKNYVTNLAVIMHKYPPKHLLNGSKMFFEYNEEVCFILPYLTTFS